MNFHDLLGVIMEVYIDNIVIKLDAHDSHWPICVLLLRGCAGKD
jgi:predicted alpha/beta-fold hydrolase